MQQYPDDSIFLANRSDLVWQLFQKLHQYNLISRSSLSGRQLFQKITPVKKKNVLFIESNNNIFMKF